MSIPDVFNESSIQIVAKIEKIEKAQPVGHAFYFTLYVEYQIGGVNRQISDIYIWNAFIELEGFCNFYPLDKNLPGGELGPEKSRIGPKTMVPPWKSGPF
jgi:hypothetical protein